MPLSLKNELVYSIVVTYNGAKWIDKCLSSLNNSSLSHETIVIDNGSTDKTIDIIKSKFSNCQLIESDENLGFGKANNIGLSIALKNDADFVFLLNQDAWVEPNTIQDLIAAQKKEPEYQVLSPLHVNGDNTKLDYLFSIFIEPRRCPNLYSDIYFNSVQDKIYETDFVNAAAWLVTKKCLQIVGGFSPIFHHYGEDDNYCMRAQFHKIKIGIYPLTKIYHDKDYSPTKYDDITLIRDRQKLVFYSDPVTNNQLKADIYINKMSAIKSIFKLQLNQCKKFYKTYRKLILTKGTIETNVNISKSPNSSFLDVNN